MFSFLLILLVPLTMMRPKVGIYCLIAFLPFMPRYLGWGVGEEALALSPRRVATIACLLGVTAVLLFRPRYANKLIAILGKNRYLVLLVLMLYLAKLTATTVNSGIGLNLLYVVDDFLISLVPAMGLLLFVRSAQDENIVIMLIVATLVISGCLALIEAVKGSVLLQGLVEIHVEEAGRGGLTDLVRSGFYRSKALFDNPLLLSEFVCISWPWATYLWTARGQSSRYWLGFGAMLAAPATLYVVHARSGWLVFALGLGAYISMRFWGRSGYIGRLAVALILTVAGISAAGFAFDVLTDPTAYITAGTEGTFSIAERLNQYVLVATAWTESPLLGFGMTRNFSEDLEFLNNLDSYWLRLILEGGAVTVVLFAAIGIYILTTALDECSNSPSSEYRRFMTAGFVSVLTFVLYKLFVSMPVNNAYFYLIAALILRRSYWRKRIVFDARAARTQ